MKRQRQRVLRRVDILDDRRLDDAFGEDRTRHADVADLVIGFDRGDQPHVRIIEEGLQIGSALILLLGAGVRIGADAGDRPVDRPVFFGELPVMGEQLLLRGGIGLVMELGAQDRADRIADRDQGLDDSGVLREQPGAAAAGFHADEGGDAIDDLVEHPAREEIAALLELGFVGGGADFHARRDIERVPQRSRAVDRLARAFMLRCDRRQGGREHRTYVGAGLGCAIIVHAELAVSPFVAAQHMAGIVEEIAVDPQRPVALVAARNRVQLAPFLWPPREIGRVLLEEEDIDDHVGARLIPHGPGRKAHGAEQVRDAGDMIARPGVAFVERISRRHEQGDAAWPKLFQRSRDEEVVE